MLVFFILGAALTVLYGGLSIHRFVSMNHPSIPVPASFPYIWAVLLIFVPLYWAILWVVALLAGNAFSGMGWSELLLLVGTSIVGYIHIMITPRRD